MIVVTGGAGFIGSCFIAKLNQLGETDILIVDQLGKEDKWKNLVGKQFNTYMNKNDFLIQLGSGKINTLVDSIIHMGACSATTERDADYLMQNNVHYSKALASWCLQNKKKFWYASSAATYGDGEQGYSDDDAETPHYRPLNMYGFSKHLFDLWILKNNRHKQLTGFKFFNVFGPNEYHKGEMRSMIHKTFPAARDEQVIRLFKSCKPEYADGGQMRDFVYIKDVVEVMAWFYARPKISGIYNLGTGRARTWNDVARAIFDALGVEGTIEYIPMPEHLQGKYQYYTQADLAKLRTAGCDHTFMPLEDSVKDYVQNYLMNGDTIL